MIQKFFFVVLFLVTNFITEKKNAESKESLRLQSSKFGYKLGETPCFYIFIFLKKIHNSSMDLLS